MTAFSDKHDVGTSPRTRLISVNKFYTCINLAVLWAFPTHALDSPSQTVTLLLKDTTQRSNDMKRISAYIRCSTDRQSTDSQLLAIKSDRLLPSRVMSQTMTLSNFPAPASFSIESNAGLS